MQLIFRSRKGLIRRIDLDDRRWRWCVIALATLALGTLLASGAAIALSMRRPATWLRSSAALRKRLDAQRGELDAIDVDAHRNINALGVLFARLQAQDARRMALGDRLVSGMNLAGSELDFHPTASLPAEAGSSLGLAMDGLDRHLSSEEQKLLWLETFMVDEHKQVLRTPHGMPVDGYISSYFGPRTDPFTGKPGFHSGVDVAAPIGTPIHAVASGIVTYAGVRHGYGNVVEIDHGNGYVTRYAHASRLLVHAGQRVLAGASIADVGSTGRSTGAHVHFEVWRNGRVLNPLSVVHAHR